VPGGEVQQSEAITPSEAQSLSGTMPGGEVQQSEAITPGEVNSYTGVTLNMTPELFDINSEGNLVVNNDQLADLFKSALNQPGGLVNFQATKAE
jgi:hypothetical protein